MEGNDGNPVVALEENEEVDVGPILVEKILSRKVLNKKAISNILKKAWADFGEFNISSAGPNIFLFGFCSALACERVLEAASSSLMGCYLSLHRWNGDLSLEDFNFEHVEFWV